MGIDVSVLGFRPNSVYEEDREQTLGQTVMRAADLSEQILALEKDWKVLSTDQKADIREAAKLLKRVGRKLV